MTFQGLLGAVNAAMDGMIYQPMAGYLGPDTLTIATSDLGYTGGTVEDPNAVVVLTRADTVAILVVPPTRPYAINDSLVETQGSSPAVIQVLNNDINGAGNVSTIGLSITNVSACTSGGTAVKNEGGTTITYSVPSAVFFGTDTFTYTIQDSVNFGDGPSTATVTVTVVERLGSLMVTISPPEAVSAGAQWKRVGTETWLNSGSTEIGIPAGPHMVQFKAITGWKAPSPVEKTFSSGMSVALGVIYERLGSLMVTISPPEAVSAGAQWKRVGTETWFDSGSTEANLSVGPYNVEFKAVTGWTAPDPVGVTISSGVTTTVSRTYDQLVGTVVVNPDPDSINAPWTLTGPHGYSRFGTGDATIMNLPIGEYTLTWGDMSGWTKPSSSAVTQTLTTSGTTTFSGTYIQDGMFYIIPNRRGGAVIYL